MTANANIVKFNVMKMTSLNISLPKSMRDFVEGEVSEGGYSTPSEYVRSLLREERKRKAERELEAFLLAGLKSGEPVEVTPAFWDEKRSELLARRRAEGR